MAARLLFVGDIHLGRRPVRWSEALRAATGIDVSELTPAAAWRDAVKLAQGLGVDAVVLAGDVVDHVENRFEAVSQLRAGVERLARAQIGVYAVAGNHDVEALPRLADLLDDFHLLGREGRWESVHIVGRDGGEVDLFGWSFPRERVDSSPLAAGAPRARPGVASLGVLHCDMDGGRSPYAPVARGELEATPLDGWLLGHIHKPHTLGGERPIGYLGSLAGLDPGETGAHGPWLVEVEGPGRVRATHRPVSPIRWERVDLTIEALGERDPRDLEDRVHAALDSALAAVHERIAVDLAEPGLRAVGCRVRVSGRGRHHIDVHRLLLDEDKWPVRERDGVHYFVEKVEEALTPDLDLADLARGADPPGLLARHLLEGQRGGPAAVALRARVAARLASELSARPRWRQLDASEPGDAEIDAWIARVGTRLLDALLAQRDARPTTARQQS